MSCGTSLVDRQREIGGDLEAGTGNSTGYLEGRRITSVAITGSVIGSATTDLSQAASISARADIGSITIGGSVRGSAVDEVVFSATASLTPTATADVTIKSVKIAGNLEHAAILAGFLPTGTLADTDSQILSVTIGGSFHDGRIYTCTMDGTPLPNGHSLIGSVMIGGDAAGAISSHKVGFAKISDAVAPLNNNPNALPIGPSASLAIRDSA
jgi:hypothetical protein